MAFQFTTSFLSNAVLAILFAAQALAIGEWGAWRGHRGAQIQTKIVLEGGVLSFANDSVVPNPLGIFYQINLTESFDVSSQNISDYMSAGPRETVYADEPFYVYGGMFYNNYQFYTFGGLQSDPPTNDTGVLLGEMYAPDQTTYNPYFAESFKPNISTGDVSGARAAGAYVSSPDQGLGFYFSGLVSQNRTALSISAVESDPGYPSVAVTQFISVNMETPDEPAFAYLNFPSWLTPRAEASLVWVPYGVRGALIVLGGVESPEDLGSSSSGPDNNFMAQVAVYDIANDVWSLQDTQGLPGNLEQRASFCTVVVPTADNHSQEILVYGGYSGMSGDPYDDVWILSVPAFQWTSMTTTNRTSSHRRQGSICIAPNPSTMITIGGTSSDGYVLDDTKYFVDVLDLNSGNWTGYYNSSSSTTFSASSALVSQLGWPSAQGPGTDSTPSSLNDTLTNLFSTRYSGVVQGYFPYSSSTPPSTNSTSPPLPQPTKQAWKIPVIATLCSVIPALIIFGVVWYCVHDRRKQKAQSEHTTRTRGKVSGWLGRSSQSYPLPEKSATSGTTGDTVTSMHPDYFRQHGYKNMNGEIYEAPSAATSPGLVSPASPGSPGMPSPQAQELMDHRAFGPPASMLHADPARNDRLSQFSESFPSPERAARNAGPVPIYHELAQDRTAPNTLDSAARAPILGSHGSDTLSQNSPPVGSQGSPRITNGSGMHGD